jgi:two-component system chemotaxis response regulator CheB
MDTDKKIKALIVDDSALMRQLLTRILSAAPDIEVVGTAQDPYAAREKIKALNPDVLTLDVEMPRMDGLTFLRNLMRLRPMPVVMLSSLTAEGAETTLEALACGAVDFMQKPAADLARELPIYADDLVEKVRAAARCKVRALVPSGGPVAAAEASAADAAVFRRALIAVGASTGGTEAIKAVVRGLPARTPPVVVSQHLPASFSASFAKHVDQVGPMRARLAEEGEPLTAGTVYIAPGNRHLRIVRRGEGYAVRLDDGPPVNRHKPSVDVMFRAVAETAGADAIGLLLTGMGVDGALGLKAMREAGSPTLAQDEASSVVWGMPGEAYRIGAVQHALPLDRIAAKLIETLNRRR